MRKLPTVVMDDRRRSRKQRLTTFLVFTVVMALSPLLYEGTLIVVSGWQGLFGTVTYPKTPVIDAIRDTYQSASFDMRHWSRGVFHATPWKSQYVIPFAIFWTGVLAMLLRRC